jgi:uncharacterized protein (TIGR02147 family)
MPDIAHYVDYRPFLADYYRECKKDNPAFSYQMLSQKAGIKSRGFLHNVIKGRRALSPSNVFGLARAMKLSPAQTEYFDVLVAFTNAATQEERAYQYQRLLAIRGTGRGAWTPQILRREQYEFYAKLHHVAVRSLVDLLGFNGDYARLARLVWPPISVAEARRSVALLLKLGLIAKVPGGKYKVTSKSVATPPEVADVTVLGFHAQAGQAALSAISRLPRNKRNVSSVTLGISGKTYERVCEEIQAFRRRLVRMAEEDKEADRVCQLNFQLFPLSTPTTQGGTR